VLIGSHPSDRGERLMSAIAKAGGGRAEKYTGSDTPVFKLKEDEIEEEKARLDFTRHRNDVVFAAQLQAQGFLRRLVWDYNQVELNGSARESLLVRDPARAKSGGPTSTPVYAWHYVGGVNAGRVAVCAIDVDGIWSKGLLESPASNVLLGDPLFFCRRTEKEKLISAALQLDAFQSDEVIVTVWGHLPKNAILNLVPLGNVGRADRDQPVALFPNTPLTYQGRFRRADDRDVYNFDVLEELPDGSSRLLGSVTAVLNPRSRAAEQVPGEPNRAVLESVAAVSDADVKTLTDSIAVPRKGIRVQRDRVWSCAFAWALMALLMAGTLVRLEPPRSLTWTAVVLATGLVLFLGGVFYAIHDAVP
jgi:hypothetical protein